MAAQDAKQGVIMKTNVNVVLVHGAWADGSSWSKVIPALQAEGLNVVAAQIPLTSLSDDIAVTRRLLGRQTGPTVLVGHSYGGAVIAGAANGVPDVQALVYIAGWGVDEGESLEALSKQGPAPAGAAQIRLDDGFLWIDTNGFHKAFVADATPTEAAIMAAVQKPLSVASFTAVSGPVAWKTVPSWFLISTADQMIPPAAQEFFAKRMNATTRTIAASHASLVSHPEAVTEIILAAVASCTRAASAGAAGKG
jgi:pimeloyl-ACP methyl ester carboxylesterase